MIAAGALFLLGLGLLYAGAETLVSGAVRLARAFGIRALVIGLTVVAFGTSAPELVVSTLASARGTADVALGNVVGSNIANIALVLALCALIRPLRVEERVVGREIPLVILASTLFLLLILDGRLGRWDGAVLLVGFFAYLAYVLFSARRDVSPGEAANGSGPPRGRVEAPPAADPERGSGLAEPERATSGPWAALERIPPLLLVLVGLGALVLGAHLLVEAAVWFAQALGISQLVVGLTVVAVGTSLPELATSGVAAARRQADLAVGNLVGSNLFNLLAILGCAALVRPLPAAETLLRVEGPVMLGTAALLLPLAWTGFELRRREGALLLAGYLAFMWVLFTRAG